MSDLNDRLNRIRITTFASELGCAAVAVDGEGTLHRLWLGYPTAEAIEARIVADHPPGERVRWDRRGTPAAKRLVELIRRYARGERIDFRVVPLIEPAGTTFQRRVMSLTRDIPYGEALSYRQVAERAGSPHAARAVGTVMAQNPLPLVIPCHRVIASNRRLGGYSGGGRRGDQAAAFATRGDRPLQTGAGETSAEESPGEAGARPQGRRELEEWAGQKKKGTRPI